MTRFEPHPAQDKKLELVQPGGTSGTLHWGNTRLPNVVKVDEKTFISEQRPNPIWNVIAKAEKIKINEQSPWALEAGSNQTRP